MREPARWGRRTICTVAAVALAMWKPDYLMEEPAPVEAGGMLHDTSIFT